MSDPSPATVGSLLTGCAQQLLDLVCALIPDNARAAHAVLSAAVALDGALSTLQRDHCDLVDVPLADLLEKESAP